MLITQLLSYFDVGIVQVLARKGTRLLAPGGVGEAYFCPLFKSIQHNNNYNTGIGDWIRVPANVNKR